MRQAIGWVILIVGFFLLGLWLNQLLFDRHQPLSPIVPTIQFQTVTQPEVN